MDPTRLPRIAQRMHPLLLQELQHAIDVRRMLTDARYARDVLLVCDALPGHDLASLAQHFRAAAAPAAVAPRGSATAAVGSDGRIDAAGGWRPDGAGTAVAALPALLQPPVRRWFTAGRRAER